MEDKKAEFTRIQERFKKLGWLPREDLLWLMATLEELLQQEQN